MKPDEIQLVIPAKLGYEKIAMDTAASFAKLYGLPHTKLEDVRTVIAEACINAMEHGNAFAPGSTIEIHMRVQKKVLQFDILDSGKGLASHPVRPDLERKLAGDESLRGWGIFLMEKLVDEVAFIQDANKRNGTQLTLHLPLKSAGRKHPVIG
ncbi:ATP-binding protein [candidate division KSB1 bacterium]|nr:ATP-binding protein [candidate division KSB1 bacterium]